MTMITALTARCGIAIMQVICLTGAGMDTIFTVEIASLTTAEGTTTRLLAHALGLSTQAPQELAHVAIAPWPGHPCGHAYHPRVHLLLSFTPSTPAWA